MKLFRVEVSKVIYIFAEDKGEAEEEAPTYANEDVGYEDVFASEAENFGSVDQEWRDSVPYGGDRDSTMTVREFFTKPEEPVPFVDPPEQLRFGFSQ